MPAVLLLLSLRLLPFPIAYLMARTLVRLYVLLFPSARERLSKARKMLGDGRCDDYISRSALNLTLMAKAGTSLTRRLGENAQITGKEFIPGDGGMVVTFHYGPWELLAEVFADRGYRLAALVSAQSMNVFGAYLSALRRRMGLSTVGDLNSASRALSKGIFLAGLLDKTRRSKGESLDIPYHGYRVSRIPGVLARRNRASIIPVVCRLEEGRLRIDIGAKDADFSDFFMPFFKNNPADWLVWGQ